MSTGKAPVGFTGTRNGMSPRQKEHLRKFLECFANEFHHGDCVGADTEAHLIAVELGLPIVIHPPTHSASRAYCHSTQYPFSRVLVLDPKDYLERNRDIVNETQGLVAAPLTDVERMRSGTWATVRYARKVNKFVHILPR